MAKALKRHNKEAFDMGEFIRWIEESTKASGVSVRVKDMSTLLSVAERVRRAK